MAYTPTVWKNGEFPPIDAEHLNKIEQGIANSAPGGFGLGDDAKKLTEADDVNAISKSGWYVWDSTHVPKNAIVLSWLNIMRVDGYANNVCARTVYGLTDGGSYVVCPSVARNMTYGSQTSDWQYENPPMNSGVEYRTTEMYRSYPLYKKLIEFPSLTGYDYVQVHGRNGFVISAIGEVRSPSDTNFWMPMVVNPVAGQANASFPTIAFTNYYSADVGVVCASTSPYIGQPARVLVTYYKAPN